jgi:hypothetical protein
LKAIVGEKKGKGKRERERERGVGRELDSGGKGRKMRRGRKYGEVRKI